MKKQQSGKAADLNGGGSIYPLINTIVGRRRHRKDCSSHSQQSKIYRINEYRSKFANFVSNDCNDKIVVGGRIHGIRCSGKKLIFIDLYQDGERVQVMVNAGKLDGDYEYEHKLLRRGDHISVVGYPWRSKSGELSILANTKVQLVSPCLHPLPVNLQDETVRMHNRVVDMTVNSSSLQRTLKIRSTALTYIRNFFNNRDFVEVQTPIISSQAGGAAAEPFMTSSTALDTEGKVTNLALRIAPELWLKRLIIGGLEKVYELGPCFRNEGIDSTHNPEFYTCEFYQSFTSLEDLLDITEKLFKGIVDKVIEVHGNNEHLEILSRSFENGFKRVDFVPELENQTGIALPEVLTAESLKEYRDKIGVKVEKGGDDKDCAKILDLLAETYLEPLCQSTPSVIMNHPQIMAPLAKSELINGKNLSRRFELFINGREYVNAYEEENDPVVQLENFKKQAGHSNSEIVDQGYVDVLEWGLPPTGGWGLGVDRLIMLLAESKRIDQVLPFGSVKTVNYQ